MDALIGYTGFVGSYLARQRKFDKFYNSANIGEIAGQELDTIVCAGVPGTKWLANKEPLIDMARISLLLHNLANTHCSKLILISTVDVYRDPVGVDETTPLIMEGLHAYGRNRIVVEQFVQECFSDCHILRLPALYGPGLKKNFIYDLLHRHCLDWTHRDSVFQFYNLQNLERDMAAVAEAGIPLINFTAEPISARDLAWECFSADFDNITSAPPLHYDVRSKWTRLFSPSAYMYSRKQVLADISAFVTWTRSQH